MPGECKLRVRRYPVGGGVASLRSLAQRLVRYRFSTLQKVLARLAGGACENGALVRIHSKGGALLATLMTCSNPTKVPREEPESKTSEFVAPASGCVFLTSAVARSVKNRFWKEVGVAVLSRPEGPPLNLWVRFVPGRNLVVFF